MRKKGLVVLAVLLAIIGLSGTGARGQRSPEWLVNHFVAYSVVDKNDSIKVTLDWDKEGMKFNIYRSQVPIFSPFSLYATTTDTSFIDRVVKPGTIYYYWVEAVRTEGGSIFGGPQGLRTHVAPPVVKFSVTNEIIRMTFLDTTFTYMEIYVRNDRVRDWQRIGTPIFRQKLEEGKFFNIIPDTTGMWEFIFNAHIDEGAYGIYSPDAYYQVWVPKSLSGVKEKSSSSIPSRYHLHQNYPNPFNPATTISYDLPTSGQVRLKVFDLLGQEVGTLVDGYQEIGSHKVTFNVTNLPSGTYFCRLQTEGFVETRKMVVVK